MHTLTPDEHAAMEGEKVLVIDFAGPERRMMEALRKSMEGPSAEEVMEAFNCIFHPAMPKQPNLNFHGPTPRRRFPIPR